MQAVICNKKRHYKDAKHFFFEEQQALNQDENITSDEVEPMDVDTTSQRLQTSIFLITFTQSLSFWKESCLLNTRQATLTTCFQEHLVLNSCQLHCSFH